MKYILDTHAFLWALFNPDKLSKATIQTIISQENSIAVSVITFWEISLKYSIGKLDLSGIKPDDLPGFANKTGFEIAQISPDEVATFYKLPRLGHRDAFDRLLIWQAIQQKRILISKDNSFNEYKDYGLQMHW
ncbi:MAG: type II toxin-antitoxin system VapC family toxin [Desulfatiglans sp.]|jgi:PIN domain nuclease of toxin-antitoxin system|nr:type II toxin-antitoxin system VapC family toxin [Desulfatiglans sp.]